MARRREKGLAVQLFADHCFLSPFLDLGVRLPCSSIEIIVHPLLASLFAHLLTFPSLSKSGTSFGSDLHGVQDIFTISAFQLAGLHCYKLCCFSSENEAFR